MFSLILGSAVCTLIAGLGAIVSVLVLVLGG